MNRTKAREYAFILLFQYKFQPEEINQIVDDFCMEYNPDKQEEYIRNTVLKTIENIQKIDELISNISQGWAIDRISSVNISLLRMAAGEMLYAQVPPTVSVNETMSLVKTYDGEESLAFMNGVLDKIKSSIGDLRE